PPGPAHRSRSRDPLLQHQAPAAAGLAAHLVPALWALVALSVLALPWRAPPRASARWFAQVPAPRTSTGTGEPRTSGRRAWSARRSETFRGKFAPLAPPFPSRRRSRAGRIRAATS